MTDKEYKDIIIGTILYGGIGLIFGKFGFTTIMLIFGTFAVLRAWPALLLPFKKNSPDQEDKG